MASANPLAQTASGARILLVEDDEIVVAIVEGALSAAGFEVFAVGDGEEAADAIMQHNPDLLVLDCSLPGKSGMQILEEVRASPFYATLPVMMLTGRRSEWHERIARDHGANSYVRKPFDPAELLIAVTKLTRPN